MYLRMLKKDLKDKVGLNIVLCIFLLLASLLLTVSASLLYILLQGTDGTYEKCNTSDAIFYMPRSIVDEEGQDRRVEEFLYEFPEIKNIHVKSRPMLSMSRLEFEGVDKRSITGLYDGEFSVDTVSEDQNIPYDLGDQRFILQEGCVAVPHHIARNAGTKVGDKLRLTTDMGNTYEFVVSHIFKDPSSRGIRRILISDQDYETLEKEFPLQYKIYEITTDPQFTASKMDYFRKMGDEIRAGIDEMYEKGLVAGKCSELNTAKLNIFNDDALITFIICIFMAMVGVLMILLTIMTIRFSLKATIKREEREIGMMKAIGVDSLSYKTLFVVKYIAFTILGGFAGLLGGIPLVTYLVNGFVVHTLNPPKGLSILFAVLTDLFLMLIILFFAFMSLRRMNKISVMDTIHGENRGERFRKLPGMFLHKSKHLSVPTYLAISDVWGRIKRYIYLIFSYTFAIVMILLLFELKNTVVSDNYRRTYWMQAEREVFFRPEDSLREKLVQKAGSPRNLYLYYKEFFNEKGIPLNIQIMDLQNSYLIQGEERKGIHLGFGDYDIEKLTIVKGGKIPKLPNEVAVTHMLQQTNGIELGDTITIEYKRYAEDSFREETVKKDFLVTAYVETMGTNLPFVLGRLEGEDLVMDDWDLYNEGLDCEDCEYQGYVEQMRSYFDPEEMQIWDYDQLMEYDLGNYGSLFDLLIVVFAIMFGITIFAQTFLYQQIFIEEETSDIAMLKSLGVSRKSIRSWYYRRITLLVGIAVVIAWILTCTIVKSAFSLVACSLLAIVQFIIYNPPVSIMVIVPAALILWITVIMMASLKAMDFIKIWKVKSE